MTASLNVAAHPDHPETSAPSQQKLRPKPEWLSKSDRVGLAYSARVLAPLLVMLVLAPWLWLNVSPFAVLPLMPLLGAYIYKLTILMHECAHYTLFKTRKWNVWCGTLCGGLLGSDFKTFSRQHWLHHQVYGAAEDPQGSDYLGFKKASRAMLRWHLLRPLLGYNLFAKLGAFRPATPVAATEDAPARGEGRYKTLAAIAASQIVVVLLVTGFGAVPWLVLLYPACAATFALFFSQIRGFCEHIAHPEGTEEAHVRTHLPNLIDQLFFYDLNFNYHVEHHTFPHIPAHHLPDVYEALKETLHRDDTVSSSIAATIRNRLAEASS